MDVLLVTTTLSLDPEPVGFHSVETVESLDDVADVTSRFDGVIVDLRDSDSLDADLTEISRRCDPLPVIAIVRDAHSGAAIDRVRLLDENWLDPEHEVLVRLLHQDVVNAAQGAELKHLRDRQDQLIHNEKFAAVGLLAAEIAHEINNPATFVITNLTVMMDYVATIGTFHDELREILATGVQIDLGGFEELENRHEIKFLGEDLSSLLVRSLTGLNRIHQIVQDLRYFGTDRTRVSNWVDLESLVRAALGLVRHEARFRAMLVVDLPALPMVQSDANRLSQVILNLLVNAVQSIDAGSPTENQVTVHAEVGPTDVVMSITDTGSGIAPEMLERIFEPFYTTKAPGEGTGLGLAISRDIMRSLGGEILAYSELGVGSKFEIVIPRSQRND